MRAHASIRRTAVVLALAAVVLATALAGHARAQEDEFLIGLMPEENIFRSIQKHRPLAALLSSKLGVKVRFTIMSRYGDIADRFVARELDGAFFGIYASLLATETLGVEPLVRSVRLDGSTTARGYLFTRRDSGIRSIADMEDARAAFVDRATATGYVFAVAMLKDYGIKDLDDFFSEQYFTGSHESVVYAVLDGKADVGAAKDRVVDRLIEKDPTIRDELFIISSSTDLPDNTLSILSSTPVEFKNKLRETLLSLHQDPMGAEVLHRLGFRKFVDASAESFKDVRSLAEKAGISIKEGVE